VYDGVVLRIVYRFSEDMLTTVNGYECGVNATVDNETLEVNDSEWLNGRDLAIDYVLESYVLPQVDINYAKTEFVKLLTAASVEWPTFDILGTTFEDES